LELKKVGDELGVGHFDKGALFLGELLQQEINFLAVNISTLHGLALYCG
jgi:hypothetical protein